MKYLILYTLENMTMLIDHLVVLLKMTNQIAEQCLLQKNNGII